MKVVKEEKQSLSWFKLAEFVHKKEKERALNLFRLLTHSLQNKAFIKKLEADILLSFDDQQFIHLYVDAAHLYRMQGHIIEAVSIYQHLTIINPESIEYVEQTVALFKELSHEKKVIYYQKKLLLLLLKKEATEKAIHLFEKLENMLDAVEKLTFRKKIVLQAIKNHYPQQHSIEQYLQKTLEGYMRFSSPFELQTFLSSLEALNQTWHKDALAYLKNV